MAPALRQLRRLLRLQAFHSPSSSARRHAGLNDAAWIADLMAHGLIRASLVPPAPIQELGDLTRTQKTTRPRDRAAHATHREGAGGCQHQAVVLLKALIAGESNAVALAALAVSRLKCSRAELKEALEGRIYATIASWLVSICG